jgi:hypothetical protein
LSHIIGVSILHIAHHDGFCIDDKYVTILDLISRAYVMYDLDLVLGFKNSIKKGRKKH